MNRMSLELKTPDGIGQQTPGGAPKETHQRQRDSDPKMNTQ